MTITDNTKGYSKIAARIKMLAGRLTKRTVVTISEHSPESIQLTGSLPRTMGWRLVTIFPIRENGRKDYIKFLNETSEKEVWIKVSTAGGRSKIYVR
jgi:hypothetical protein